MCRITSQTNRPYGTDTWILIQTTHQCWNNRENKSYHKVIVYHRLCPFDTQPNEHQHVLLVGEYGAMYKVSIRRYRSEVNEERGRWQQVLVSASRRIHLYARPTNTTPIETNTNIPPLPSLYCRRSLFHSFPQPAQSYFWLF